jgi:hypothetical protein
VEFEAKTRQIIIYRKIINSLEEKHNRAIWDL